MRNAILFIIFLIFSFFINVVFYYISDDYRLFLKNIKNDSDISKIENSSLSLNNENNEKKDINIELLDDDIEFIKPNNENDIIFNKSDNNKVQIKSSINL
jgi:hypothetical protein